MSQSQGTARRAIILCGTGSLASINVPGCVHEISNRSGLPVNVVLTRNALQFTTRRAVQAMSRRKVWVDDFADETEDGSAPHVILTGAAALVVAYPATANFIAKVSNGLADDLATAVVLAADCPVLIVPSMHERMWKNAATQANIERLKQRGIMILTGATPIKEASFFEKGVMLSVNEVVEAVLKILKD